MFNEDWPYSYPTQVVLAAGADVNLLSVDAPADNSDSESEDCDESDDDAAPPPPPPSAARRMLGSGLLSLSSWFQRARTNTASAGSGSGGNTRGHRDNHLAHRGGGDGDDWVTPLYVAARCGNLRIVELLLKKGADVRWANRHGATPLWAAATVTCVGDVSRQTSQALGHSAHGGNVSLGLVRAMLAAGADPNVADHEGVTPLYLAAQEGHVEVVSAPSSPPPPAFARRAPPLTHPLGRDV